MADARIYIASAPLAPGKTPGQWTASGKVTGMQPKGSVWRIAEAAHGFPANTYLRSDYPSEPVETPAPTPSPAPGVILASGECFITTDDATFGLNAFGGLGTKNNAPAGIATDKDHGFLRVGLYLKARNVEVISRGVNPEGSAIAGYRDGVRFDVRNMARAGRTEMPGTFASDGTWTGEASGLRVVQRVKPAGAVLTVEVDLTNTGSTTIIGLRYMRVADFDDLPAKAGGQDTFRTINKRVAKGHVQSGLQTAAKGLAGFLRSDDPRFVTSFGRSGAVEDPYLPLVYDAPPAIGATSTADTTITLTDDIGSLAPGETRTVVFEVGVG